MLFLYFKNLLHLFALTFIFLASVTHSLAAPEPVETLLEETTPLLIDVEQAKSMISDSPRTVFVDVRPKTNFSIAHIPGSLQIPLHHIKTKSYLKEMSLILVNRGFQFNRLQKEAKTLSEKGFTVQILAGGLASWVQHGEKLRGSQPATNDFHLLSPYDFLAELHSNSSYHPEIFLLSKSLKDYANLSLLAPGSPAIERITTLDQITKYSSHKKKSRVPIVVCTAQRMDTSRIVEPPAGLQQTVFIVEGGLEGIQEAQEAVAAMQKPRELRTATIEPCSVCPSPETENRANTQQ